MSLAQPVNINYYLSNYHKIDNTSYTLLAKAMMHAIR